MILLLALVLSAAVDPVDLVRDGKAVLPIQVGTNSSPALRATAADLGTYLGRISGGAFHVGVSDEKAGIYVGLPGDFALPFKVEFGSGPFEREDYVLKSSNGSLFMIGATDLAVSHAVWDLLGR